MKVDFMDLRDWRAASSAPVFVLLTVVHINSLVIDSHSDLTYIAIDA